MPVKLILNSHNVLEVVDQELALRGLAGQRAAEDPVEVLLSNIISVVIFSNYMILIYL